MIQYLSLLCTFFFCLQLTAQQPTDKLFTWQISAETASCPSAPEKSCLRFKGKGMKDFKIIEENIEGFSPSKGSQYTIQVAQLAGDDSSLHYKLVKILKEKSAVEVVPKTTIHKIAKKGNTELEVSPATIQCEATDSKKCLLVKTKKQKEFQTLETEIAGFLYEEGNHYLLMVKTDSNGHYTLLKEISKQFVQAPAIAAADTLPTASMPDTLAGNPNGKWYLHKLIDPAGVTYASNNHLLWVELSLENGQMTGFGACNKFSATISTGAQRTIGITDIISGSKNCGNKKIEDMFYSFLQLVQQYEMRGGQLDLIYEGKAILSFSAAPVIKD